MADALLIINAGSSSIKFALFPLLKEIPDRPALSGQIDGIGGQPHLVASDNSGAVLDDIELPLTGAAELQHRGALDLLVKWLLAHNAGWRIAGIGHRVVHGGEHYSSPILLDENNIRILRTLIPLAPLHQPHNLAAIESLATALSGVPQVACFDTAFHRSQPAVAQLFALPRAISAEGVRRYGFHGSSYEYIAHVLPKYLGPKADGKVIVAHLGNGASMCVMENRKSVATTMGFTALDGLMMGTRTGALDPGVLLYLMDQKKMDAKALTRLLYKESGLLGVSGLSQDLRELLASDKPEAAEAVDLFCYRINREIGALAAAGGGLDAIVFTGGIGEHAALIRERVCTAAAWLGVKLDSAANARSECRISAADSKVAVIVLRTNEEWMIARHTADLIRAVS